LRTSFGVGHWRVDPALNSLAGPTETAHLEPKVMEVLVCLAEHASDVVSKERLLRSVWPDTCVTDDVLTRAIFELRRAFGDNARRPRVIQTIPKRGYRLIAPVVLDVDRTPASPTTAATVCTLTWGEGYVTLADGTYLLGRDESLPIRVPFPSVSRRHARITIGGGVVTVEDLASKNGTFLRDARLTAPTLLRNGDTLITGTVRISVRLSMPSTETAVPAGRLR
jgi:DNA-binding winged helix-turn-helix (wHTH) protein